MAEIEAEANNTNTSIDVEDSSASSTSSGYVFAGWANWPDSPIINAYVIRAVYNKV